MTRKIKILIISIAIIIVLFLISIFLSVKAFGVANPFSSFYGFCKITFTDTQYVQIQSDPKVIIAKSDSSYSHFLEYMSEQGYTHLENEQIGSIYSFSKNGTDEIVRVSFNAGGYFSEWKWEK